MKAEISKFLGESHSRILDPDLVKQAHADLNQVSKQMHKYE